MSASAMAAFQQFDRNHDGSISRQEFAGMMGGFAGAPTMTSYAAPAATYAAPATYAAAPTMQYAAAPSTTYAAPAATYAATAYAAAPTMQYAAAPATTYGAPAANYAATSYAAAPTMQYAAAPATTYAAPASYSYAAPAATYEAAPAMTYAAPAATYAAPASVSYAAPAATYSAAPAMTYAAPAATYANYEQYAAPTYAAQYAAPATTYAAPTTGSISYAAQAPVTYAAPAATYTMPAATSMYTGQETYAPAATYGYAAQNFAAAPSYPAAGSFVALPAAGAPTYATGAYAPAGVNTGTAAAIDGLFTDPNHHKAGTLEGIRVIHSDATSWTMVGTDNDGVWWSLKGPVVRQEPLTISIDFSPKGGPSGVQATYANGKLTHPDGNFWSRVARPPCTLADTSKGDISGVYADPKHYKAGTLSGVRLLSVCDGNRKGGNATLMGSNDGSSWWVCTGTVVNENEVAIDFSPLGGKVFTATYRGGKLTLPDGTWPKQAAGKASKKSSKKKKGGCC